MTENNTHKMTNKLMTSKQFAEQNSIPRDWELDGSEKVVYLNSAERIRVCLEKNTDIEFVVKSIVHADSSPSDYAMDFADDLMVAIRDNLSAHHIHMLLLWLSKELSDWQFELGCEKLSDPCGEFIAEISKIKGFENKELQAAIRIARRYRNAQSGVDEAQALIELGEFAIGNADELTPEPVIRQRDAEIDELRREVESLREYRSMVLNACGELDTLDEYRTCLKALESQREELAKDALRYKKLRKLNVPQFQELFKRNIANGTPFDQLVDELAGGCV